MSDERTYKARIKALKRGQRGSQAGLYITLYKPDVDEPIAVSSKDGSVISDFCTDKFESDYIKVFEETGVGNVVSVTKKKNDRGYWNIRGVVAVDDAAPAPAPVPQTPKEKVIQKMVGDSEALDSYRVHALDSACKVTNSLLMGNTKVFPAKVQPEVVVDFLLSTAEKTVDFIKNGYAGPASAEDDLDPEGVDPDEVELPDDDENPLDQ